MVNGFRYYRALGSVSTASALSTALTIYPSPDPSPSNSNFLQLGRRSGGRCKKMIWVLWCLKILKVARQCRESYSKANRMLELINRTMKYKNQEVLMNLYKSMVRPHNWNTVARCGVLTMWKINRCLRRYSAGLLACSLISRNCHMKPGLKNLDCGRSRRGETEQTL